MKMAQTEMHTQKYKNGTDKYGTNDKQASLAYITHVQKWHSGTIIFKISNIKITYMYMM